METRKDIRLKEFDYSQNGAYFITMCVKDNKCILWNKRNSYSENTENKNNTSIVGETCGLPYKLSDVGNIVNDEIKNMSFIYPYIFVDRYVIMPNHIHIIIVIDKPISGRPQVSPTDDTVAIPRIIQQFKGVVTKKIGYSIWQRSYYDVIIRNKEMLKAIREYIETNPLKWSLDKYYKED